MRIKEVYDAYRNSKIANRILAVVTVICVLQMLGSMIIYGISYRERKQELINQNIKILEQANNNYLATIVNQMAAATREIFYDELFWNSQGQGEAEGSVYSILAGKLHSLADVDSIYLFSGVTNKFYIMDEASFLGIPVKTIQNNTFVSGYEELSQMEWFWEAKEKEGSMAVTRNKEIRKGKYQVLSFSRYLKHPLRNREDYYAVSINISLEHFKHLEEQLCETGEKLFVLDEEGTCVYYGENEALAGNIQDWYVEDQENWFKEKIQDMEYIGIRNRAREHPWTMIKLIPSSTILNTVLTKMVGNCLVTLCIFLAGIFILKAMIQRTTMPIEKLAKMMRHYQQGTFVQDEKMAGRRDEIGILYQSYEKMNQRIDQLIESEYMSQIHEKQARLEALQAQVDPHFLYNTLQTVSGIAIEKNVFEIEEINNSLSKILRYSLNKKKSLVMLKEELSNVQNYMDIQKYRFGDRIRLQIQLSPEILNCPVPVFTLQLAVENAMKHGLETKLGTGTIRIYDDKLSDTMRRLYVKDNGNGISPDRLEAIQKMLKDPQKYAPAGGYEPKGLVNLNERLKSQFGQEYGVEIRNNQGEGAVLIIYIPARGGEQDA